MFRFNILGISIDNLSKNEILSKINQLLKKPKFHQIATVNPEFILESHKNQEFKKVLNDCDLRVADGIGIKFAFWRFGKNLKCRITGADLMLEILKIAQEQKLSIFLAVKKNGLSNFQETKEAILKIYPNIAIGGDDIDINSVIASEAKQSRNLQVGIATVVTLPRNDILFCNFGAPHQELFINSQKCDSPPHLSQDDSKNISNKNLKGDLNPSLSLQNDRCGGKIRLAMGVGGSFDFLTGKVHRAPQFMQIVGLEWLWRIFQPQEWKFKKERLRRIFRAVIIFPIKIIINKK